MNTTFRIVCLLFLCFAFANGPSASAQLAFFDFEGQPVDGVEDGSNSSISITNSGLTVTISRTGGINFDVLNDDAWGNPNAWPNPGWGDQALSPFFAPGVPDFFLVNFSLPVNVFGVQMGDFGGDVDQLTIEAYSGLNGTGALLDSAAGVFIGDFNLAGAGDGPESPVVSASGIQSVLFRGGGSGNNNVYYDNFRVSFTPVPEPGVLPVLAMASLGLALIRRRKN